MARGFPSVIIENVRPLIDGGRYPIKRVVGEDLVVEADIFKDGHDIVAAALKWRCREARLAETAMKLVETIAGAASSRLRKRHLRIHGRSLDRYIPRLAARVCQKI